MFTINKYNKIDKRRKIVMFNENFMEFKIFAINIRSNKKIKTPDEFVHYNFLFFYIFSKCL